MMGLDNPIHLAFLGIVLLLVFGAKRLPEMGHSLGTGLRGFKEAIGGETAHTSLATTQAQPQFTAQPQTATQPQTIAQPQTVAQTQAQIPTRAPAPAASVHAVPTTHTPASPLSVEDDHAA
jgi:sec-independent protein translocase protein TatA